MALAPAAGAVTGGTLYVNATTGHDTGTCRLSTHPCRTIDYGLTQASTNSTIKVAQGIYRDQVVISKSVTILGAGENKTIIEPLTLSLSETDANKTTPQGVIVFVSPGTTGAKLQQLQVNGAATKAQFNSCVNDFVGVYYRDASGSLSSVKITNIQQPTAEFGCQPGPDGGFYAATDQSTTPPASGNGTTGAWVVPTSLNGSHVSLSGVVVNNYDKNGITCKNVGTICNVAHSTVAGIGPTPLTAQNGIELWGAAASITYTTVTENSYTSPQYCPGCATPNFNYSTASGILVINTGNTTIDNNTITYNDDDVYGLWDPSGFGLGPATQGTWTIDSNTVENSSNNTGTSPGSTAVPFGDGVGDGIDLDGPSGVFVENNAISVNDEYGIGLFDAQNSEILNNTTGPSNGEGIYVGDNPNIAANTGASSGNTISGNQSSNNHFDGILADVTAQDTGNTFTSNTLNTDTRYGIEDLSTGGGTDGTANTWTTNSCSPPGDTNVPGLC